MCMYMGSWAISSDGVVYMEERCCAVVSATEQEVKGQYQPYVVSKVEQEIEGQVSSSNWA